MISKERLAKLADKKLAKPSWKEAIVMKRDDDGEVYTNVPHRVIHHSPSGYNFGYAGSGPADLALNICQVVLKAIGHRGKTMKCWEGRCYAAAFQLHQNFKTVFIAPLPRAGGSIQYSIVEAWIKEQLPTLEEWIDL